MKDTTNEAAETSVAEIDTHQNERNDKELKSWRSGQRGSEGSIHDQGGRAQGHWAEGAHEKCCTQPDTCSYITDAQSNCLSACRGTVHSRSLGRPRETRTTERRPDNTQSQEEVGVGGMVWVGLPQVHGKHETEAAEGHTNKTLRSWRQHTNSNTGDMIMAQKTERISPIHGEGRRHTGKQWTGTRDTRQIEVKRETQIQWSKQLKKHTGGGNKGPLRNVRPGQGCPRTSTKS